MRKILIYTLIFSFSYISFGQVSDDPDEIFGDANAYFNFEDYTEALYLYIDLTKHFKPNAHIYYKIGVCYLQIPGEKHKALPFLLKAKDNLTRYFNQYSLTEKKAPYESLFYLGNAYLAVNKLDSALYYYEQFESIINKRKYDLDYLRLQQETCRISKLLQESPINYIQKNLGSNFNNRFDNFNAILSGDGKTLAYTSKLKFYDAIMVSKMKADGTWSIPMNITLQLKSDIKLSTQSLSYDGTELYIYRDDNHDGNLYVTKLDGSIWSPIERLNENINTKYWESNASISKDGQYLYFSSNRPGGHGDLDIYVSKRKADGSWGVAKNIGKEVNTPFHDAAPFLSADQKTLFFSSLGHQSVGGYDIYFSKKDRNGKWSTPVNLGYPLNTTDDEMFYSPIELGESGLISKHDPVSFGKQDIFEIELFSDEISKQILTKDESKPLDNKQRTLVIDTMNNYELAVISETGTDETFATISKDIDNYQLYFGGKRYQFVPDTFAKPEQDLIVDNSEFEDFIDDYKENDSIFIDNLSLLSYTDSSSNRSYTDSINITVKNSKIDFNDPKYANLTPYQIDSIQRSNQNIVKFEEELASLEDWPDLMRDINMSNDEINRFYQWVLIFSNDTVYIDQLAKLKENYIKSENKALIDTIIDRIKHLHANKGKEDSIIQLVLTDYLKLESDAQKDFIAMLDNLPEKNYSSRKNDLANKNQQKNKNQELMGSQRNKKYWPYFLGALILGGAVFTLLKRIKS